MTLEQTKEIIIKWVDSCVTSEQLSLLEDVAGKYIMGRIYPEATNFDCEIAYSDICETIRIKDRVVAANQPSEYPTLELNKNLR